MAEEKIMICPYCKKQVVASAAIQRGGRKGHVACVTREEERVALFDYLNKARPGIVDWRMVSSQCKTFLKKYKLDYKDLLLAVRYQEEVLRTRSTVHDRGIGLLPNIYEEAKEYWEQEAARVKRIEQAVRNTPEPEVVFIPVAETRSKRSNYIDPLKILREEGEE